MSLPLCQNYIAGARTPSSSPSPTTPVFNPSTGETIASCPVGTKLDAEAAIAAAAAAFPAWSETPPVDRARVFFRYRHLVEQNFDRLAALICREHG